MVGNPDWFGKKGIEGGEYIIDTTGGDTEEWKEETQKAHDMREELSVQFELRNSYEELRNQLEEWEEDKQWKAREESNRRANVERNLPTIPEGGSAISTIQIPTILAISGQKLRQTQRTIWVKKLILNLEICKILNKLGIISQYQDS